MNLTQLELWPAIQKGDSAYYNGMIFGYFGRIVSVTEDGIACMFNSALGWIYSDQWVWDAQNRRWWVDLSLHKPIVKAIDNAGRY